MGYRLLSALICICLILCFACGCNPPKDQLTVFNNHIINNNYDKALLYARSKVDEKDTKPGGSDLLWTLQISSLYRIKQMHPVSTLYLDRAEEMLNYYKTQGGIADLFLTTAVNDNALPYRGSEYEGIMINTYKALNLMQFNKDDLVRVEFNRAVDRQRMAKEIFNQEIAKLQDKINSPQNNDKRSSLSQNYNNPDLQQRISQNYAGLQNFAAYPDFVNPFTTYLAGVYFNLIGDHEKAVDLLKESCGMVPDNNYIQQDFVITDQMLDGRAKLDKTVWLFFENGLGPIKEEFRIDLPLFIFTDKVKYVGIALPKLTFRQQAYPYLLVRSNAADYQTQIVSDMDRVVQTEFNKQYPFILTRAIISATAKALAQYALEQQNSDACRWASIAMAIYSFATTAADVRIWTMLPKNFQVARFAMPADKTISIIPPGGMPFQIQIPDCNNALVYVKIVSQQSQPVYDIITF